MQPLPTHFRGRSDQKGFEFTLLKRIGKVCLLSKTKPEWKSGAVLYEVVLVKHLPETRFPNGKTSPEREAMPSAEEWGRYGWSPATLEAAHRKFADLVEAEQ